MLDRLPPISTVLEVTSFVNEECEEVDRVTLLVNGTHVQALSFNNSPQIMVKIGETVSVVNIKKLCNFIASNT